MASDLCLTLAQDTSLSHLPREALVHILSFLTDPRDFMNASHALPILFRVAKCELSTVVARQLLLWWNRFPLMPFTIISTSFSKMTLHSEYAATNDLGALLTVASSHGLVGEVKCMLDNHTASLTYTDLLVATTVAKLCNQQECLKLLSRATQTKKDDLNKAGQPFGTTEDMKRLVVACNPKEVYTARWKDGALPILRCPALNHEPTITLPFVAGAHGTPAYHAGLYGPRRIPTYSANSPYPAELSSFKLLRQLLPVLFKGMSFTTVEDPDAVLPNLTRQDPKALRQLLQQHTDGHPANAPQTEEWLAGKFEGVLNGNPETFGPYKEREDETTRRLLLCADFRGYVRDHLETVVGAAISSILDGVMVGRNVNKQMSRLFWCAVFALKTKQHGVVDKALAVLVRTDVYQRPNEKTPSSIPQEWLVSLFHCATVCDAARAWETLLVPLFSNVFWAKEEAIVPIKQCWMQVGPLALEHGAKEVLRLCLATTGLPAIFFVAGLRYTLENVSLCSDECLTLLLEHPALARLALKSLGNDKADSTAWASPLVEPNQSKLGKLGRMRHTYHQKRKPLADAMAAAGRKRAGETIGKQTETLCGTYGADAVFVAAVEGHVWRIAKYFLAGQQRVSKHVSYAVFSFFHRTAPTLTFARVDEFKVAGASYRNRWALGVLDPTDNKQIIEVDEFAKAYLSLFPADELLFMFGPSITKLEPQNSLAGLLTLFDPQRMPQASTNAPAGQTLGNVLLWLLTQCASAPLEFWDALSGKVEWWALLDDNTRAGAFGTVLDYIERGRHAFKSPQLDNVARLLDSVVLARADGNLLGVGQAAQARARQALAVACGTTWRRLLRHVVLYHADTLTTDSIVSAIRATAPTRTHPSVAQAKLFLQTLLSCGRAAEMVDSDTVLDCAFETWSHQAVIELLLDGGRMCGHPDGAANTHPECLLGGFCRPNHVNFSESTFVNAVIQSNKEGSIIGPLQESLDFYAGDTYPFSADTLCALALATASGNQAAVDFLQQVVGWPPLDSLYGRLLGQAAGDLARAGLAEGVRGLCKMVPGLVGGHRREALLWACARADTALVQFLLAGDQPPPLSPPEAGLWGALSQNNEIAALLHAHTAAASNVNAHRQEEKVAAARPMPCI